SGSAGPRTSARTKNPVVAIRNAQAMTRTKSVARKPGKFECTFTSIPGRSLHGVPATEGAHSTVSYGSARDPNKAISLDGDNGLSRLVANDGSQASGPRDAGSAPIGWGRIEVDNRLVRSLHTPVNYRHPQAPTPLQVPGRRENVAQGGSFAFCIPRFEGVGAE